MILERLQRRIDNLVKKQKISHHPFRFADSGTILSFDNSTTTITILLTLFPGDDPPFAYYKVTGFLDELNRA
jgi:hypothetical protein